MYPFTNMEFQSATRQPNGLITITGGKMDPRYPEAELMMFERLMQQMETKFLAPSQTPAANLQTYNSHSEQPAIENLTPNQLAPIPNFLPQEPKMERAQLLSDAIKLFIEDRIASKPGSQKYYMNGGAEEFALVLRIIGDKPITELKRDEAIRFFNIITKLPARYNRKKKYRGKSISEIIAMGDTPRKAGTVNNTMWHVNALFDWLTKYGYVSRNYFDELYAENDTEGRSRVPFSTLRALFEHSIYTDHEFSYNYQYWAPLIALHSGMRLNEICQLRPTDIQVEDGILFMHVLEDDEMNSVKTKAGIRRVPVHPKLLALGFKDFVNSRQGFERLFSDGLSYDTTTNSWSSNASSWFYRLRLELDCYRKGEDFHSFRHLIIETLVKSEERIDERLLKALVGHSNQISQEVLKPDVTFDIYAKMQFNINRLHELVCRLDFSRILEHVKPWHAGIVPHKRKKASARIKVDQSADQPAPMLTRSPQVSTAQAVDASMAALERVLGRSLEQARSF